MDEVLERRILMRMNMGVADEPKKKKSKVVEESRADKKPKESKDEKAQRKKQFIQSQKSKLKLTKKELSTPQLRQERLIKELFNPEHLEAYSDSSKSSSDSDDESEAQSEEEVKDKIDQILEEDSNDSSPGVQRTETEQVQHEQR